MANNFLQQPDFNLASEALQRVGDDFKVVGLQLANCVNLPPVNEGRGILDAIQQLRVEMQANNIQINNRLDMIENRMHMLEGGQRSLQTQILAANHNNLARVSNRHLTSDQEDLMPLHDLHNVPIPGFPRTAPAIRQLSGPELDALLEVLGVDSHGTIDAKQNRLQLAIGLRPIAI